MEVRRYLYVIGRRWTVVALVTVVIAGIVAAGMFAGTNPFAAATTLTTSPPGEPKQLIRFDSRAEPPSSVGNVREIIGSLPVAERTIAKLQIPMQPHELRERIRVDQVEGSDLIRVTVMAPDQASAIRWADTIAQVAVGYNQELSRREATLTREFIERQVKSAQANLASAEAALAQFKMRHPVVPAAPSAEAASRASALYAAWRDTRVRQQELTARAAALDQQIQAQGPVLNVEEGTASNPTIQRLRAQLADIETQLATARAMYTLAHPDVRDLERKAAAVTARLQGEAKNAFVQREPNPLYRRLTEERLIIEVDRIAVRARSSALEQALRNTGYQASRLLRPGEEAEFTRLTRDVAVAEREYTGLRAKLDEARILEQEAMNRGLLRVVDPARPVSSRFPNPVSKLALALIAGLVAGVALAFVAEHLDVRIRTPEAAESFLGVPALAMIPRHNPPFERAYRHLRTRLRFLGAEGPPKLMAFVSPRPGDGRSTVAVNVALAFAKAGYKVVLVDCDLYRPSLHMHFNTPLAPGVSAVLAGTATTSAAMCKTDVPGIRVIPAGSVQGFPSEVLGSAKLREVLDVLRNEADVVIIDTPPAALCDESLLIASYCDAAIQLLPGDAVPEAADVRLRDQLRTARAQVAGVVVTKADPASVDSYTYENNMPGRRRWAWAAAGTMLVIIAGAALWMIQSGLVSQLMRTAARIP